MFEELRGKVCKSDIKLILAWTLKLFGLSKHLQRIQGVVDAVLCELRDEMYIDWTQDEACGWKQRTGCLRRCWQLEELKALLLILTNLGVVMGSLCNSVKLLIKQQIKREIIHLLHKIIDDRSNCYVDKKHLMK